MKKILLVLIIAFAAAGTWLYRTNLAPSPDGPGVITLYGNIDIRQVSLAFENTGRVLALFAEEGDRVEKGRKLAEQDVRTAVLNAAKQRADIAVQEANLRRLRNGNRPEETAQADAAARSAGFRLDQARRDAARAEAMFKSSSISRQDWENSRTALLQAEAARDEAAQRAALMHAGFRSEDIAAAEAQLASMKAALDVTGHAIAQGTLYAPCDAVVTSRLLEPGDMASPSSPVFLLSLTQPKWVRTYTTERQLGLLRPGMKADVYCDSFPEPVPGHVGYMSPTAEFTPKSVQTEDLRPALLYEVRIIVDDADDRLRLGMPVTVKLERTAF